MLPCAQLGASNIAVASRFASPSAPPGLSGGDISPVALDHHARSGGHGMNNVLFIERSVNAFTRTLEFGARGTRQF